MIRMILTDLDGTLLRSDRTISEYTLEVLEKCRRKGILIAISTARGEFNTQRQIREMKPDIVISSSGALVKCYSTEKCSDGAQNHDSVLNNDSTMGDDSAMRNSGAILNDGRKTRGEVIFASLMSVAETNALIEAGFQMSDGQCEITVDALKAYYWNYKVDPTIEDPDWGETTYTDYRGFKEEALKLCMLLEEPEMAAKIAATIPDCECQRFSGGNWYKFTKAGISKAKAIEEIAKKLGISVKDMVSFGDDVTDAEMLNLCGTGVAGANAVPKALEAADEVCESNDEDGVARWLERNLPF